MRTEFTVYEKMLCAEREYRLRRHSYENLIAKEKLTRPKADYQLECMRAIADEYRAKWDGVIPVLNVDNGYMA